MSLKINKILILFFITALGYSQSFLKNEISVVEYNTSWNKTNFIKGLDKLKNCKPYTVILCENLDYMDKFDIRQPTIVVYNNGDEVARFKSTIMLDFDVSYKDLQKEVDKLLLNKFN